MKAHWIAAALGALSLDTMAQQQTAMDAKVTDPTARVPPASYRSAFESYVPYREPAIAPWREVNEDVARTGGHAGIFRPAGRGARGSTTSAKPAGGEPGAAPLEAGAQPPARGAPEAAADKPAAAGSHHAH